MGAGLEAVKERLVAGFRGVEIRGKYDVNTDSTVLLFEWQNATYWVRVSREFDDDYASGTTAGLSDLVEQLRTSPENIASVKTTGIAQE
jgi:hypothetical protein